MQSVEVALEPANSVHVVELLHLIMGLIRAGQLQEVQAVCRKVLSSFSAACSLPRLCLPGLQHAAV